MANSLNICISFRATEAGGCVSAHLDRIDDILARFTNQDRVEINQDYRNGDFRLTLPKRIGETEAQSLAEEMNGIEDNAGRAVVDAEIYYVKTVSGEGSHFGECARIGPGKL